MSDQPEALRVADALEVDKWHVAGVTLQTAADLLREQHAEIEALRAERNAHSGTADAAWSTLSALRDALRRMDPAWCELHAHTQLDDEEFDRLLGTLEDLLEDKP